jgi:deoxyribodipyrimidine photolyase-related protein
MPRVVCLHQKIYVAPGDYIKHMSNYCDPCRFHPDKAIGEDACPFATLYLDFLQRIEMRFAQHPRTAVQWRNLSYFRQNDKHAICKQATQIRKTAGT